MFNCEIFCVLLDFKCRLYSIEVVDNMSQLDNDDGGGDGVDAGDGGPPLVVVLMVVQSISSCLRSKQTVNSERQLLFGERWQLNFSFPPK